MESTALDQTSDSVTSTPSKVMRVLLDGLQTAALSLLLFLAVSVSLARVRIESISMEPTLYRGEFVLINKIAVIGGDFRRGDVIVFKYPPDPDAQYIKRLIEIG